MYAVPIHRHAISSIFHHICWFNPLPYHVIPTEISTLLSIFGHALTQDVFKLALFFAYFKIYMTFIIMMLSWVLESSSSCCQPADAGFKVHMVFFINACIFCSSQRYYMMLFIYKCMY
ncbi:hypothetical protein BDA99DRAFT_350251 [Phascolomyces articulosus]|uniref:Uncharacterized protein n=1 Tax=Phascolomyces articulosus TaxID=60185 RepID=A0AAD5K387_9FUNG|nr:hypothetical protein BDA99DRAFT_350251 [Phascolomyces articulosus]